MKIFKNNRGETIAETIIALSILAIGITLSATLMANNLRNMNVSKNRVVAVNIAREGIEAMRNVRDTNWLKFSGKRRICWNHKPGSNPSESCEGSNPILAGNYITYKDENHRWRLAEATGDLDMLYKVDIDTSYDTDGDGNYENDGDMYNHISNSDPALSDALGDDYLTNTSFSRIITINYLSNDGSSGNENNNRMEVISTVTWTKGSDDHTVTLKTHLTDYLGRDNLL